MSHFNRIPEHLGAFLNITAVFNSQSKKNNNIVLFVREWGVKICPSRSLFVITRQAK